VSGQGAIWQGVMHAHVTARMQAYVTASIPAHSVHASILCRWTVKTARQQQATCEPAGIWLNQCIQLLATFMHVLDVYIREVPVHHNYSWLSNQHFNCISLK
jgi:hypothetical protein